MYFGPVVSYEPMLANHVPRELRSLQPSIVALETEALGVALVADNKGPGFLAIRGVVDHAVTQKTRDGHGTQPKPPPDLRLLVSETVIAASSGTSP